jgi:hypothetical protein
MMHLFVHSILHLVMKVIGANYDHFRRLFAPTLRMMTCGYLAEFSVSQHEVVRLVEAVACVFNIATSHLIHDQITHASLRAWLHAAHVLLLGSRLMQLRHSSSTWVLNQSRLTHVSTLAEQGSMNGPVVPSEIS